MAREAHIKICFSSLHFILEVFSQSQTGKAVTAAGFSMSASLDLDLRLLAAHLEKSQSHRMVCRGTGL